MLCKLLGIACIADILLRKTRRIFLAKRGGFPGGMPGNMNNLMKQAQKMQRQMEEAQKE